MFTSRTQIKLREGQLLVMISSLWSLTVKGKIKRVSDDVVRLASGREKKNLFQRFVDLTTNLCGLWIYSNCK
jgi:hypothetical protein